MADVKISELPAATTPLAGTEQIPLVQSGSTKKVTVDGLFTSANLGTPSAISLTNATNVPVDQATGTLPVNHGGTGAVTLTGIVKGSGTSAFTAATAGTDYVAPGGALGTPSSGTATNLTGLPLSTGVTGLLPVANGGTGTATPALVAGTNVTISGSWPNQTINATGGGGSGDVTGPASSTDNAVARFDSTTGKIIQNSGVVINDSGEVTTGVWKGTEVGLSYGGTGASSASQARGNILPSYTGNAGKILAVNVGATDAEWIAAGGSGTVTSVDVSGGTTGLTTSGGPITAAGTITLAGTLAVANGGTGSTTAQTAMNTLAGAVTSASYLRGNGTNVVMSAIQVADVPTLNQNTTGSAGSVANALTAGTGISFSSGTTYNGSAAITINNAGVAAYPGAGIPNSTGSAWGTSYSTTGTGTVVALATSPSLVTPILGTPQSGDFSTGTFTWPTFNQNTSGTAAGLSATLSPASGGTGVANNASATVTSSGNYAYTRTLTGVTNVTFPTTGTLATLAGTETLTNKTITGTKETVYAITDGAAFEINPANGGIQTITLGANRTPAATNFTAGQSVTLMIDDGSAYAITWSTVNPTWVGATATGSAPTLATTGYTIIEMWKVGSTIYAAYVGVA